MLPLMTCSDTLPIVFGHSRQRMASPPRRNPPQVINSMARHSLLGKTLSRKATLIGDEPKNSHLKPVARIELAPLPARKRATALARYLIRDTVCQTANSTFTPNRQIDSPGFEPGTHLDHDPYRLAAALAGFLDGPLQTVSNRQLSARVYQLHHKSTDTLILSRRLSSRPVYRHSLLTVPA